MTVRIGTWDDDAQTGWSYTCTCTVNRSWPTGLKNLPRMLHFAHCARCWAQVWRPSPKALPASPPVKARLDEDRTARPKTQLLGHARVSADGKTHSTVAGPADTLVNLETGERVFLYSDALKAARWGG